MILGYAEMRPLFFQEPIDRMKNTSCKSDRQRNSASKACFVKNDAKNLRHSQFFRIFAVC